MNAVTIKTTKEIKIIKTDDTEEVFNIDSFSKYQEDEDIKNETMAPYTNDYNYILSKVKNSEGKLTSLGGGFDARYDFAEENLEEEYIIDEENLNKFKYGALIDAINDISGSRNSDGTFDLDKFKEAFMKHFNFKYCLVYYLQMMLFAQIDNAGKNAMFDCWQVTRTGDNISYTKGAYILYPRPYDMDSQMGEDNSGNDRITAGAEINPELSPGTGKSYEELKL